MTVNTKRVTTLILKCPECGEKHYSITGGSEGYNCIKCNHFFGKDIPQDAWVKTRVGAIECPTCHHDVIIPDNITTLYHVKQVSCPKCEIDIYNKSSTASHSILAVKIGHKWVNPNELYYSSSKNGILPVKDEQDIFLMDHLKSLANREPRHTHAHFMSPEIKDVKLLRVNHEIVGYYASNKLENEQCLRQVFVRDEFRKKGYGTLMLNDFIDSNETFVIEAPISDELWHWLVKYGYLNNKGESQGKVSFIYSGM